MSGHNAVTERLSATEVERAVSLLRDGQLVGLPTETVYGLAASGLDAVAVARIFAVKGRPADNPLILHVSGAASLWPLVVVDDRQQRRVERLTALWPGPLTVVLPSAERIPSVVTAGLKTVAVRVPDTDITRRIIERLGGPVAAPSANRSGRPSPTTADHALADLGGHIAAVVDGGPCGVGVESTVVDLCGEQPRILRPGAVSRDTVQAALQEDVLAYDRGHVGGSPGVRHRHYRPDIHGVSAMLDAERAWTSDDALLLFATTAGQLAQRLGPRAGRTEVLPDDPGGAMRSLYAALLRLEGFGVLRLQIELPSSGPEWSALDDRMRRAAGQTSP